MFERVSYLELIYSMWVLDFPRPEIPIYLHDLQVKWDGDTNCNHQNRVSPWEIERVGSSISVPHCLSSSVSKRPKFYFTQGDLDAPILGRFHNMKLIQVPSRKFPLLAIFI